MTKETNVLSHQKNGTTAALLLAAVISGCTSAPAAVSAPAPRSATTRPAAVSPSVPEQGQSLASAHSLGMHALARQARPGAWTYVPPAGADGAKYQHFAENSWTRVAEQLVSTFSAQVDTGSYANVRRFLAHGLLPPKEAVRVEELLNYFDYNYAQPTDGEAKTFQVQATVVRSPWNAERDLLRISLKARDVARALLPPANLVFLVDVSGPMASRERLPLVKSALMLLVGQLRPVDRVTIVTYASGARVVLPPTAGDRTEAIRAAINQLNAGGGTYGEAGIRMAYSHSRQAFIEGGINRVILATDGDLNIGMTSTRELKTLVETERDHGVGLTTLGVGDDNYNETLMKQLADAGNGTYRYLDSLQEAQKVLVHEFTSTLAVVAEDTKLQVEFNPRTVDEYRLIGYELSPLRREDFNNDRLDAAHIGPGHAVTALYEFVPHGNKGSADPLRYGNRHADDLAPADGANANEFAWVKLRYKEPGAVASQLMEVPVTSASTAPALERADPDLRFAVAVAGWGEWLRRSSQIGDWNPVKTLELARSARGEDRYGVRAEFLRLVELSALVRR